MIPGFIQFVIVEMLEATPSLRPIEFSPTATFDIPVLGSDSLPYGSDGYTLAPDSDPFDVDVSLPYGSDGYTLAPNLPSLTPTLTPPDTIDVSMPNGSSLPYGSDGYTLTPDLPLLTPIIMPSDTIDVSMPDGSSLPYGSDGYTLAPGI